MTAFGAKLAFAVAGERLLMRRTAPVKLTDGFRRIAEARRRPGKGGLAPGSGSSASLTAPVSSVESHQ
jgi:hypothetical protein